MNYKKYSIRLGNYTGINLLYVHIKKGKMTDWSILVQLESLDGWG